MPTIADILQVHDLDAQCLRISVALGLPLKQVTLLVCEYGNGNIYASNGIVMPNTSRNRNRMVRYFGNCVVIDDAGNSHLLTERGLKVLQRAKKARKQQQWRKECRAERRKQRTEEFEIRDAMHRQREFNDLAATSSGKKRQGKANSREDFGHFVNRYEPIPLRNIVKTECTRIVKIKVKL